MGIRGVRVNQFEPMPEPGVLAAHGISLGALAGSLIGWLPLVAALVPMVYYLILIWESRTVQHWMRNARMRRKARKIAKLKAKLKVTTAALDAEETIREARVQAREKVAHAQFEAVKLVETEKVEAEKKIPPI